MLAQKLGVAHYSTPPTAHLARRHEMDANASDLDHYQFYLTGVQIASRELKELSLTNDVIILDRYWPTTVAYHRAMGIDAKLEDFGPLLMQDLIMYFEVQPYIQMQRLTKSRIMSAGDMRMLSRMELLRAEYDKLLPCWKHIRIDTSNREVEDVTTELINKLPLT